MATSFAPTFCAAPAPARARRGLPAGRLAAFATLAAPIAAAQAPLTNFVPAFYAQQFGISLATLGAIFLAERLWGVLADPIVGALSDRTRSRFGRRRPWIAAGAAVYAISTIALFFPPAGVTPIYLGLGLFAIYLGWAMIQIPYLAWSGEISRDYHERTRIATFVTVGGSSALLLVLLLPTAIDQLRPGDDRLRLAAMGATILATLVPAVWLTLRAFPEAPAPAAPRHRSSLATTLRIVLCEKLLLRVLLSDLAVTFGQGIRGALFLFVVSIYMGLPQWGSAMLLSQFVFGIAAGPIWLAIARRFGKHRTAIAGELAQVGINLSLLAISPGNLTLLVALTVAQGLAQGSGNLMLRAIVADVADEHRLRTGQDRTALFFSAFSISMKAGMALAVGVALPLVGAAGFNPAAGAHNTPQALHALVLVFALGPALGHLCSAALLRGFPLDEAAHAEVRRELDHGAATAS